MICSNRSGVSQKAVEIHIDELKQQKQALETALKTAKRTV